MSKLAGNVTPTLTALALAFAALGSACGPQDGNSTYSLVSRSGTRGGSVSMNSQSSSTRIAYAVRCEGCGNPWLGAQSNKHPEVINIPNDNPSAYVVDGFGTAGDVVVAQTSSDTSPWIFTTQPGASRDIKVWGDPHVSSDGKSVQWEPHKSPGLDTPELEFATTPGDLFIMGNTDDTGKYSITTFDRTGAPSGTAPGGLTIVGGAVPGGSVISAALALAPKTLAVMVGSGPNEFGLIDTRVFAVTTCTDCQPRLIADVSDLWPEAVWSNGSTFKFLGTTADGTAALVISDAGAQPVKIMGSKLSEDHSRVMAFDGAGNAYVMISTRTDTTLYGFKNAALTAIGSIPMAGGILASAADITINTGMSFDSAGSAHLATVGRTKLDGSDMIEYAVMTAAGEVTTSLQILVGTTE